MYTTHRPIRRVLPAIALSAAALASSAPDAAAQAFPKAMEQLIGLGGDAKEARRVHERIHMATGFGNTFLVNTNDGCVVVDTSMTIFAPRHRDLLRKVERGPVRYIVLTHAHEDHVGGIDLWKQEETKVVAHRLFLDQRDYQELLAGFFAARNAAQFSLPLMSVRLFSRSKLARPEPDVLFEDRHAFTVGDTAFEVHHTPGETPCQSSVWIPSLRAAFVGDNFYPSFPNIYTLRGTRPRWAMDYVRSLDKVLAWKPEYLLPSHGDPIVGAEEVARRLKRYRDAIQYVHDQTVKGMNEGKDVFTLMKEIKLPDGLHEDEVYGKVSWSVRGIYEGYVGWFDGAASGMYSVPERDVHQDLVELAGGPEAVASRAREKLQAGEPEKALHLCEVALAGDRAHRPSLEAKVAALTALRGRSRNVIEGAWLESAIRETKARLAK